MFGGRRVKPVALNAEESSGVMWVTYSIVRICCCFVEISRR